MTNLEQKGGDEALKLFKKAVENCKPLLEVKTRRVGGANYQVPIESQPRAPHLTRNSLAGKLWPRPWRKGMIDKLTNELLDAANGRGAAMRRRKTFIVWPKPTRHSRTTAGKAGSRE